MTSIDTFTAGDIAALRGDEQWTADVLATARGGLRIRIRPHHQPDAPYWVDAVTHVNVTTRAHFDKFRAGGTR